MLYVVVREVEGIRSESTVFTNLKEATEFYEGAAYIVRNAPGKGATEDLTIVTATALFAADAADPESAKAMTLDGRAFIMGSEEWIIP